jgi:hypothetical protein
MRTIGEVFGLSRTVEQVTLFFGVPEGFIAEYKLRCRALGEAMIKDYKRTPAQIVEMPPTAPLGPKAQDYFNEFEAWVKEALRETINA